MAFRLIEVTEVTYDKREVRRAFKVASIVDVIDRGDHRWIARAGKLPAIKVLDEFNHIVERMNGQ